MSILSSDTLQQVEQSLIQQKVLILLGLQVVEYRFQTQIKLDTNRVQLARL